MGNKKEVPHNYTEEYLENIKQDLDVVLEAVRSSRPRDEVIAEVAPRIVRINLALKPEELEILDQGPNEASARVAQDFIERALNTFGPKK